MLNFLNNCYKEFPYDRNRPGSREVFSIMAAKLATLRRKLFINGEWCDSDDGSAFEVRNPSTNETIAKVPQATSRDVDRAVETAHRAFDSGVWSNKSAYVRSKVLLNIAEMIRERADEIARIESMNVGKPIEGAKGEIFAAADDFEYFAGAALRALGHTFPPHPESFSYTLREPIGVCAQIIPWNYPFFLGAVKLAPALACGNAVVLKPASYAPLTPLVLAEICMEAGVPEGVVNVICGPGEPVGSRLVAHPLVDKVAFTGETATGRKIAQMAAASVKRLSLELGGKNPCIVFKDAAIEEALARIAFSVFYNAGQTCTATTRIFVEKQIFGKFVSAFVDKARKLRVGDPEEKSVDMGPLISPIQRDRVAQSVREGLEEKGEILCGGKVPNGSKLSRGNFFQPTVIIGHAKMKIARDEIFGPVAVFIPFGSEDEVVQAANDSIYGLVASVWTGRLDTAHRMASRIKAGRVLINGARPIPGLPYGGYKQSGIGREDCLETIDLYTELKAVAIKL